jgi:hypothetical protein
LLPKLRTSMHIIPGNIVHAREADIVRCFEWRSLHDDRSVDLIRQTIDNAAGRPETAYSPVMVMMPRFGE